MSKGSGGDLRVTIRQEKFHHTQEEIKDVWSALLDLLLRSCAPLNSQCPLGMYYTVHFNLPSTSTSIRCIQCCSKLQNITKCNFSIIPNASNKNWLVDHFQQLNGRGHAMFFVVFSYLCCYDVGCSKTSS